MTIREKKSRKKKIKAVFARERRSPSAKGRRETVELQFLGLGLFHGSCIT